MHEQNPMNQIWPKCTKSSETPIFLWCENFRRMHEKCINACNLIKKKEKTCLTLGFRRKPLKLWPRKRPQKKKRVRRNRREKQRNSEKGLSDSYLLFKKKKKMKFEWSEGIRTGIEIHLKIGSIDRKKSGRNRASSRVLA